MSKKKTVLILGCDGYLGYTLSIYLQLKNKCNVIGIDDMSRRYWVQEIGSHSIIPIENREEPCTNIHGDITDFKLIKKILRIYNPDVIVHLAEQPSAPYSMMNIEKARFTQKNNVLGTLNVLWGMKQECPNAHLIKLGTMGEYGCPNIDITEGPLDIEFRERKDSIPFPKQAGSFYHLSKVFDSQNIEFACKMWGLRATDINQGPVYGSKIKGMKKNQRTRFDIDHVFGTVINRFCAQAVIGYPLTVYGKGGQTRGYININDAMRAIELIMEKPSKKGEFRVINQIVELFSVNEIAEMVQEEGKKVGLNVKIKHIKNPRIEKEEHYYNPDHKKLLEMGLKPRGLREVIVPTLKDLIKYKKRIDEKKDFIKPSILWNNKNEEEEENS